MPFKTTTGLIKPEPPKATIIYGRWDVGKTFAALTAAEDYPPLPFQPKAGDPVTHELKKTGLIMWEKGSAGMQPGECNLHPAARIEVHEAEPSELIPAIQHVVQEIRRLRKELGITHWIHDSLTAFDVKNMVHWSTIVDGTDQPESNLAGGDSDDNRGQGMFRAVLNTHIDYYNGCISVEDTQHIFVCHAKAQDGGIRMSRRNPGYAKALAGATLKARSRGLDINQSSLIPAITGQAWDHYFRSCDIVAFMDKEIKAVPGPTGAVVKQEQRRFTLRSKNNIAARCRYARLADEEEADFRVLFGKLLAPASPVSVAPTTPLKGK